MIGRAVMRGVFVLTVGVLVASFQASGSAGKYEYARQVGKRCSTCHESKRPHVANLNAAGRYFLEHRTLEGYKPAAPAPQTSRRAPEGSPSDPGLAVYNRACVVCHGPTGQGTALAGPLTAERKHARTEAEAVAVIADGIDGTAMAAFKGALTEREIRDVANYVMSLAPRRSGK